MKSQWWKDTVDERGRCIKTGKVRYASGVAAQVVALQMLEQGWPTRMYRCPWCNCFHLTRKRKGRD